MEAATRLTGGRSSKGFDSLEQDAHPQLRRAYDRLREIDGAVFQSRDITAQQDNALRVPRSMLSGKMADVDAGESTGIAPGVALVDDLAAGVRCCGMRDSRMKTDRPGVTGPAIDGDSTINAETKT